MFSATTPSSVSSPFAFMELNKTPSTTALPLQNCHPTPAAPTDALERSLHGGLSLHGEFGAFFVPCASASVSANISSHSPAGLHPLNLSCTSHCGTAVAIMPASPCRPHSGGSITSRASMTTSEPSTFEGDSTHHHHHHHQGPCHAAVPLPLYIATDNHSGQASQQVPDFEAADRDDVYNILNEDRSRLLVIPAALVEPTEGSQAYMAQKRAGDSAHLAFKFRLCRLFGDSGRCPSGGRCAFIHSRTAHRQALAQVDVHFNPSVTGRVGPQQQLPAGTTLSVWDARVGALVAVDSGCVLRTKASLAVLQGDASAPRRPQRCSHYDRACCARGSQCGFIHVLPDAPVTAAPFVLPASHAQHSPSCHAPPPMMSTHHSAATPPAYAPSQPQQQRRTNTNHFLQAATGPTSATLSSMVASNNMVLMSITPVAWPPAGMQAGAPQQATTTAAFEGSAFFLPPPAHSHTHPTSGHLSAPLDKHHEASYFASTHNFGHTLY